jgi:hypothetical protein
MQALSELIINKNMASLNAYSAKATYVNPLEKST